MSTTHEWIMARIADAGGAMPRQLLYDELRARGVAANTVYVTVVRMLADGRLTREARDDGVVWLTAATPVMRGCELQRVWRGIGAAEGMPAP
jgi:hypothetical protein